MGKIARVTGRTFRPRPLWLLVAAALSPETFAAQATTAVETWRGGAITFERNDGQFAPETLFVARGVGGEVRIRRGEVAITPSLQGPGARRAIGLRLANANLAPEVEARDPLAARSHYYLGGERRENVPHFGEVVLRDVYPAIDLALHGRQGALEYDFIVAPGADPRGIRLDLSSAEELALDAAGNLVMRVGGETLRQHAPVAYQEYGDVRVAVEARFDLAAGQREAGFVLGDYDRGRPLVIDPLVSYSTFLGGSANDFGGYMKVDPSGNVYVAHTTAPDGFSATSSLAQVTVTKIDPVTRSQVFSTTIGGSGNDMVTGLAIGASGSGYFTYIAGSTSSGNFPRCLGSNDCAPYRGGVDTFVAALDQGGTLVNSWLLGGSGNDRAGGIATDVFGNVFVTGTTDSSNFPVTVGALAGNRLGSSASGDLSDAFLVKLNRAQGVRFATYIGGSGTDVGVGVAVDPFDNIYVTGRTASPNFPLLAPTQSAGPGLFLMRLGASGGPIQYSTYLGGSGDNVYGIAVDITREAVISGDTTRNTFPVVGSTRTHAGGRDVFAMRMGASGGPILFSTLLGGSGDDLAGGVAINSGGDIVLTGSTTSPNFPTVTPYLPTRPGFTSAFVSRFRGGVLDYSTYLGGSGVDTGASIVADDSGNIHVAGRATSPNFPTFNAYRTARSGQSDMFVTKLQPDAAGPATPTLVSVVAGNGQVTVSFTPGTGGPAITGYEVVCNGTVRATGTASPIVVTGLTNGVTYNCSVRAVGVEGAGAVSQGMTAQPLGPVTFLPSPANLGNQSMQTTSMPLAVTLTNSTGTSFTVTSVTATPPFSASSACGLVPNNGSCQASVRFTPTAEGPVDGMLTFDTTVGPRTVPLAGTGQRSLVVHYYGAILNRAPDEAGRAYWESEAARLAALGANPNEVSFLMANYFFNSAEYLAANKTDTQFLVDVYNTFFNRAPDQGGFDFWMSQMSAGLSREGVIFWFMFSSEFRAFTQGIYGSAQARPEVDLVMDLFRGFLNRFPETAALNAYVGLLRQAQCAAPDQRAGAVYTTVNDLSYFFLFGSPEYANRARSNAQFVSDLYNAFLRRGGSRDEVQFWIDQLASGAKDRNHARADFVASPEFAARVQAVIAASCLP